MIDERSAIGFQSDWGDVDLDDAEMTPSAGTLLRHARKEAGLHIAVVASLLKVQVKTLEALEQDRLDLLPDAMFARAMASSVCRSLKRDPAPVLIRLPKASFRVASFHEQRPAVQLQLSGRRQGWTFAGRVSNVVWVFGLTLVGGVILFIYMPQVKLTGLLVMQVMQGQLASTHSADQNVSQTQVSALADSEPRRTVNTLAGVTGVKVDLPAALTVLTAFPQSPEPSPIVSPVTPERIAVIQASPPLSVTTSTASPVAGAMLSLSASKESWVKVVDAKGVVLMSRLLAPGEVVQASGIPPLDAVIGRADVVRVEVRGKWLDLVPLSRDNVARFEVN